MLRYKSLCSLIFISFLTLPACDRHDSTSVLQNRFGEDNRIPLDRPDYPWRAIGKVFDTGCTGTMVGRDIVLTAAHCVVDPATKKIANNLTWFRPNYVNGSAPVESWIEQIWTGTFDPEADRGHDWAVLRLREPIGDKVGWISVNPTDSINFPDVVMAREAQFRVGIANSNVPNMLGQISTAMADAGLNIHNMLNKSKGEMAYTLVDVDSAVPAQVVEKIAATKGVLAVRYLPSVAG